MVRNAQKNAKRIMAAALAVAMAATFTGCKSSGSDTDAADVQSADSTNENAAAASESGVAEGGTAASSDELYHMDVVLDWYPNAIHTFLYDAIDKGYFADEGLDIELISPAESIDALTFVSADKAQIGLTYPIEVINAEAEELSVHAIGAVTQTNLTCLTTLEGSGITEDMSTLKGKKIAYDGTASTEALVRTVAASADLADDDYELINVGFDLTTALTTGSADAAAGMMVNDEIITMKNAGYDVVTFNYSDYGAPEMYDIVMAANEDEYQANLEYYEGFLRACYKGFRDMKDDEDASLEIIMNEMNSDENPLDEDQQRQSYETLVPCMETDDAPFLSMTTEKWQSLVDWMGEQGLLEASVNVDDFVTSFDAE